MYVYTYTYAYAHTTISTCVRKPMYFAVPRCDLRWSLCFFDQVVSEWLLMEQYWWVWYWYWYWLVLISRVVWFFSASTQKYSEKKLRICLVDIDLFVKIVSSFICVLFPLHTTFIDSDGTASWWPAARGSWFHEEKVEARWQFTWLETLKNDLFRRSWKVMFCEYGLAQNSAIWIWLYICICIL